MAAAADGCPSPAKAGEAEKNGVVDATASRAANLWRTSRVRHLVSAQTERTRSSSARSTAARPARLDVSRLSWTAELRDLIQTPEGDTWMSARKASQVSIRALDEAFDRPGAALQRRLFDTRDGLRSMGPACRLPRTSTRGWRRRARLVSHRRGRRVHRPLQSRRRGKAAAFDDPLRRDRRRSTVDLVGLPFDPACLSFHENRAAVSTASSAQVRSPLYSTSIGRWKRYGDGLKPLIDALNDEGVVAT